jgi:hypothetical protein
MALLFISEDSNSMSLRNVGGISPDFTASHPSRQYSQVTSLGITNLNRNMMLEGTEHYVFLKSLVAADELTRSPNIYYFVSDCQR